MLNNYNFRFEYLIDGKLFVSDKKKMSITLFQAFSKISCLRLSLFPKQKLK